MRVIFFIIIMLLNYCTEEDIDIIDPASRTFWCEDLSYGDNYTQYKVNATLYKSGEHCIVYIDENAPLSMAEKSNIADRIISEFDNVIYPQVTQVSTPYDSDGNGKVILLILDIRDNYPDSSSYYAGYFYYIDMFDFDVISSGKLYHSNHADMMYIDCYPSDPINNSTNFFSTIAHEFFHLVSFSSKYMTYNSFEKSWVDEGLAQVCEDMVYGAPRADRVKWFAYTSGDSLLKWDSSLIDYANTYMFFRYLADRQGSERDLLQNLVNNNLTGLSNVENAIKLMDSKSSFFDEYCNWVSAIVKGSSSNANPYPYKSLVIEESIYDNLFSSPSAGSTFIYPFAAKYFGSFTNGSFVSWSNENDEVYAEFVDSILYNSKPYTISDLSTNFTFNIVGSDRGAMVIINMGSGYSIDIYGNEQYNSCSGGSWTYKSIPLSSKPIGISATPVVNLRDETNCDWYINKIKKQLKR